MYYIHMLLLTVGFNHEIHKIKRLIKNYDWRVIEIGIKLKWIFKIKKKTNDIINKSTKSTNQMFCFILLLENGEGRRQSSMKTLVILPKIYDPCVVRLVSKETWKRKSVSKEYIMTVLKCSCD